MKKLITGIAVAMATALIGSAAFAIEYDGDVQVNLGIRITSLSSDESDETDGSASFPTFGIENYNLFKLNDIFSAGFMESINFGTPIFIDDDTSIKFLVGPAASAKLGSIVKFQAGAGLAIAKVKAQGEKQEGDSSLFHADYYDEYSFTGIGFGLDLQAKFLPQSKISPLVGFRYTYITSGKYDVKATAHDETVAEASVDETINANFINVYLGASYNF